MRGPARLAPILIVAAALVATFAAAALAHGPNFGGRAKRYGIGTPTDSGAVRCGHGIYGGPRTSCVLAGHVFSVFARGERALGHPPGWVRARGSRHSKLQRFGCEIAANDHAVVCYARSGALVDFLTRTAARSAGPAASAARYCGQTAHHGLRAPLPIHARRVSCRSARRLIKAWQKKDGPTARCIPPQDEQPHRTCTVRGWRCTAGQSRNGATIPVACRRRRRRVSFEQPV